MKYWIWIGVFLFMTHNANATSAEAFKRHVNPVFIETGSYVGKGIKKAVQAGFQEIYSIELSPRLYKKCTKKCNKLLDPSHVHLYLGNSPSVLQQILPDIHENATFWLDARYSAGHMAMGNTHTPILDELNIIANHPMCAHTILINDVHLCGTPEFDFITIEELAKALLKINPNYLLRLEDGDVKNSILVAEVSEDTQ